MKTRQLFFMAMLIAIAGLVSCTKTEKAKPITPVPVIDTILTQEKFIGKWEVTDVLLKYYDNGVVSSTQEWIKNVGKLENGQGPFGSNWTPQTDVSYITFAADGSFAHVKPDGTPDSYMLKNLLPPTGKWKVIDPKIIQLTTLYNGVITELTYNCQYKSPELIIEFKDNDVDAQIKFQKQQ